MVDHFESTLLMIMQIDSHNQLQPVSLTMNTPAEINAVINSHSTYGKVNTLKLCTSELRNQSQSKTNRSPYLLGIVFFFILYCCRNFCFRVSTNGRCEDNHLAGSLIKKFACFKTRKNRRISYS